MKNAEIIDPNEFTCCGINDAINRGHINLISCRALLCGCWINLVTFGGHNIFRSK